VSTFPPRGVPILMYHNVSPVIPPNFRKYTMHPQKFARQMYLLRRWGFHAISPDMLMAARGNAGPLPQRPVLITFDDGFSDCMQFAVPVLRECGFTATFYIVSGRVGATSEWLHTSHGLHLSLMNWDDLRRLHAQGFTIAAHTRTHPHLTSLDDAACREEIAGSRTALQNGIDGSVDHFAYPYGDHNDAVRSHTIVAGFASACSVRIGRSAMNDDPFALHRVPVSGAESMADFVCRVWSARTMSEYTTSLFSRAFGERNTPSAS
jgi:peptidoglycan/xylan/chitin deacetylase (PgdA/CDA1 family)